MLTKRQFGLTALGAAGALAFSGSRRAVAADDRKSRLEQTLSAIEAKSGGRLGAAVLDTGSGLSAGLRPDERFPMCSTFKCLAAAAVLQRVDRGQSRLDQRIRFEAKDVVANSPTTKDRVESGMTLAETCEAALTLSDNTAGNLLLREIGGPPGVTRFARSLGDEVTRLDRWEVELNEALPGDPRDTTTPAAMAKNLQRLILGDALSEASRRKLTGWMVANKTGGARLRAGLPRDCRVADKTGAGERGTTNDVAIFWAPGRKPVVVAAYLTGTQAPAEQRNATLAHVARAVAEVLVARRG
jgi:beta-lactamase class A